MARVRTGPRGHELLDRSIEPVCRLKSELPADLTSYARQVIGPGLWLLSSDYRVECDHYLGDAAPEPIRREHGGESWRTGDGPAKRHPGKPGEEREKAARAARVREALVRHGGDERAAAVELGMKLNAFVMVAKYADRHEPKAVPA